MLACRNKERNKAYRRYAERTNGMILLQGSIERNHTLVNVIEEIMFRHLYNEEIVQPGDPKQHVEFVRRLRQKDQLHLKDIVRRYYYAKRKLYLLVAALKYWEEKNSETSEE